MLKALALVEVQNFPLRWTTSFWFLQKCIKQTIRLVPNSSHSTCNFEKNSWRLYRISGTLPLFLSSSTEAIFDENGSAAHPDALPTPKLFCVANSDNGAAGRRLFQLGWPHTGEAILSLEPLRYGFLCKKEHHTSAMYDASTH